MAKIESPWDPKDPDARDRFRLDWAAIVAFDDKGESTGDTIVTSTWDIPAGLTEWPGQAAIVEAGLATEVGVDVGGEDGDVPFLTNTITTAQGRIIVRRVPLQVRRQVARVAAG